MKGSIDLIRSNSEGVEILDFKTEKKPDRYYEKEKLNRYRRQLETYAFLVEQRTGQRVNRMHLYFTGEEGNPYVTFRKNKTTIGETIADFDNIVARIEKKDFRMESRPDKLCSDCDMRRYCDEVN